MRTVTIRELHARTGKVIRETSHHGEIQVTDKSQRSGRGTDATQAISEDREDRL